MAEKGFGVKEINLIGASGTPTIESPNNLNLNAVNVAISTNATIGGNLTVTGNVGVAGTLTYEDVTNIDAIGIITARAGVVVGDTSNTTFRVHRIQGSSATNCGIAFDSGGSLNLFTDSSGAGTSRISISAAGNIQFSTMGSTYFLLEDYVTHAGDTNTQYGFDGADSYVVKTGGSTRLAVNNSGAQVTGTISATQISGAGSAITNLSAANLTGTLPSNVGFGTAIAAVWHVGHTGASNYNITGPGNLNNAVNPDLYLERNKVYQFNMNASGHGFGIQTSSGTWNSSNEYTTGITNARASTGIIRFSVPNNAPSTLYYACTSSHSGMVGTIYIYGGSSTVTVSGNGNNRVITGGSGGSLVGEDSFTYNGTDEVAINHVSTSENTYLTLNANANRRKVILFKNANTTAGCIGLGDSDEGTSTNLFLSSNNDPGGASPHLSITSDGYVHLGNSGHGTNKVGGQSITGEDFDPYFKLYTSTSNHWLMHLRSDTATGSNGIFMRAGNNSNNYSMYITARDENNLHLSVRGDGVIQSPQQVGCAVRLSSNFTHPGNANFNQGTNWVMPFDTEVWDIGDNFDTSSYTFTAPVAGRYLCCYTIQIESISSWQWLYIYPVVTGTGGNSNTVATNNAGVVFSDFAGTGITGNTTTSAQYATFTNTVVMNLTANQAVRMGTRGNISATIKGSYETQWTMQLLG